MFAFPIRLRYAKFDPGQKPPAYPARAECVVELSPEDIFGGRSRGTPLVIPGETVGICWDANKGQSKVETKRWLKTIRFDCVINGYEIHLTGGEISISFDCGSEGHLLHGLKLLSYLPLYLSLFLAHPIKVDAFYGRIGECTFNCEIASGIFQFHVTTEERQKELTKLAFDMTFGTPLADISPRLLAAIGYLYTAMLLSSQSPYSSAFLPEIALNLAKVLDVMFTDKRDKLRQELKKLGFSKDEIEKKYVPLTLIRNKLDVAHPTLFMPTKEQRSTFDSFVDRALSQVVDLLKRTIEKSAKGEYEILFYDMAGRDNEQEELIKSMSKYVG